MMRWLLFVVLAGAIQAQIPGVRWVSVSGRVVNSVTGDLVAGATLKLISFAGPAMKMLRFKRTPRATAGSIWIFLRPAST